MQTATFAQAEETKLDIEAQTILPPSETVRGRRRAAFWEKWTEPLMFTAAFVELLLVAGLIHRGGYDGDGTRVEYRIMSILSAALWPAFIVEGVISFLRRSPEVSASRAAARVLMVWIFPPLRLGWVNPVTNLIWFPILGRQRPSKAVALVLDRKFGTPMLLFAFLILPVLAIEMYKPDWLDDIPYAKLALDGAVAAIWVAFAFELIVKASAAPNTLKYLKDRWLDVAIVGLPTLEFVLTHWVDAAPLARLFKMTRAVRPEQIQAVSKAYRLRGLMMKGWQAFLLIEGVARITGNTPEKRLAKLEARIEELEVELSEARRDADALRRKINPNAEDEDENDLSDPTD